MTYELAEIGNLVVVIAGAVGSLLLIIFKSRCTSILWGCIIRENPPVADGGENA